uniref:Uncharacterized protein n=1 Tax=Oryza glumipatula TaxID=40148 RepID=A0A0D9YUM9_9ORYZ
MFGPYSGGGGVPLPQMDADTYVRTIAAMPPHPLAPPPDSPRTPHTYVGFLPVFGDLPPLTGAVLQEPVPVPPEQRADQPVAVATENSAPTRPQLCAPYDDEVEATLRAMETNPAERPSPYFLETTQGGRMSALVRASMIAFMGEFSRKNKLADGTLQRAAYFLDRYLSSLQNSYNAVATPPDDATTEKPFQPSCRI